MPAISVPNRVQEGAVVVSDRGLAFETLGTGLRRPAASGEIGGQHTVGAEDAQGGNAASHFS